MAFLNSNLWLLWLSFQNLPFLLVEACFLVGFPAHMIFKGHFSFSFSFQIEDVALSSSSLWFDAEFTVQSSTGAAGTFKELFEIHSAQRSFFLVWNDMVEIIFWLLWIHFSVAKKFATFYFLKGLMDYFSCYDCFSVFSNKESSDRKPKRFKDRIIINTD